MIDVLAVLFGIFVFALLGHALWVLLAFLLHCLFGRNRKPPPQASNPVIDRKMSIFWAIQQIETLVKEGRVDAQAAEQVVRALCDQNLQTPPPAVKTAPTTSLPPVTSLLQPPPLPTPLTPPRPPLDTPRPASAPPPPPPPPPAPPIPKPSPPARERWQDLLAAFLEESNIRWGELTGGMLIFFCSSALVMSFWTRITELWYLQVGLFTGITAALFGLGLYAHRRWRLPNTSMGLLCIATLLTPLSFLLISAFGQASGSLVLRSLLAEGLSLAILGFLLAKASFILIPAHPRALTLSVLTLSGLQFVLRRIPMADIGSLPLFLLCAVPLLVHAISTAWVLRHSPNTTTVPQLWFWLFTAFPTLLLVILCGLSAGDLRLLGQRFAALVCLYGGPSLFTGLRFRHHRHQISSVWISTAGTLVGVLGLAIMGGGLLLAWPMPANLLPALWVTTLCYVWLALRESLPEAWLPASLMAAFSVTLIGLVFHRPELGWTAGERALLRALFSGDAGRALVPAVWGLAGLGLWLRRGTKLSPLHGRGVLYSATGLALLCVLLLGGYGIALRGDPFGLRIHYCLFGLLALAMPWIQWIPGQTGPGPRWHALFTRVGMGLLTLALLQSSLFVWNWETIPSLLLLSSLTALGLFAVWFLAGKVWTTTRTELLLIFWFASLSAFAGLLFASLDTGTAFSAPRTALLALLWLSLAVLGANRSLWQLGQLALALAAIHLAMDSSWILTGYAIPSGLVFTALLWAGLRARIPLPDAEAQLTTNFLDLLPPEGRRGSRHQIGQQAPQLLHLRPLSTDHILLFLAAGGLFLWYWKGFLSCLALEMQMGLSSPRLPPGVEWMLFAGVGLTLLLGRVQTSVSLRRILPHLLLGWAVAGMALLATLGGHTQSASTLLRWSALLLVWTGPFLTQPLQRQSLWVGGGLLLGFSLYGLWGSFLGWNIPAPVFFAALGKSAAAANLGLPLFLLCLYLWRLARRERREHLMTLSALTGHFAVLVVFLVDPRPPHQDLLLFGIRLLQAQVLWGALFGLAWNFRRDRPENQERWLHHHFDLSSLILRFLLIPPAVAVFFHWNDALPFAKAVADGWGILAGAGLWISLALAMGNQTQAPFRPQWTRRAASTLVGRLLWLIVLLLTAHHAARSTLLAYRGLTLTLGMAIILGSAALWVLWKAKSHALLLPRDQEKTGPQETGWIHFSMLCLFLLSVRVLLPPFPNSVHADLWAALPMALLGLAQFAHAFLSVHSKSESPFPSPTISALRGALCFQISAFLLWSLRWAPSLDRQELLPAFFMVQCLATLPGTLLSMGLLPQRPHLRLHLNWATLGNTCFFLALGFRLFQKVPLPDPGLLFPLALGTSLLLNLLALRDSRDGFALHRMFFLPWAAVVLSLQQRQPAGTDLLQTLCRTHGISTLAWSALWALHSKWIPWVQRLGFRARPASPRLCLLIVTLLASVPQMLWMLYSAGGGTLSDAASSQVTGRLGLVFSALLLAGGLSLLAKAPKTDPDPHSGQIRLFALAGYTLSLLGFSWSWVDPSGPHGHPVQYTAIAFFSLLILGLFYASLQHRKTLAVWSDSLRLAVRVLTPIAALALLMTLLLEFLYAFVFEIHAPLPLYSVLGVTAALLLACTNCIRWAMRPTRDPFRLPESRRALYIYAAEALLALLMLHLRFSFPELFTGFFLAIWPLLVMGLSFLGLGLSALWERKGLTVLALPISRTALFLPLLPLIGFWSDPFPVHESLVLLIMGGLYGTAAIQRKSFWFSVLAASCANAALWVLLQQTGDHGFFDRPQLWVLPFAFCLLIAGYLNRQQLGPIRHARLRYTCASLIYLSSTAEMFIQGVARVPYLPLVLMGLSVAGILAGMLLRLRSFLFYGLGFLLLSLITILYHASANLGWTWIWYVAGIALGIGILILFAAFESKREALLARLAALRQWQG